METRKCSVCKKSIAIQEFYPDEAALDASQRCCNSCCQAIANAMETAAAIPTYSPDQQASRSKQKTQRTITSFLGNVGKEPSNVFATITEPSNVFAKITVADVKSELCKHVDLAGLCKGAGLKESLLKRLAARAERIADEEAGQSSGIVRLYDLPIGLKESLLKLAKACQSNSVTAHTSPTSHNDAAEKLEKKEEACSDGANSDGGKLRKRIHDDISDESDFKAGT